MQYTRSIVLSKRPPNHEVLQRGFSEEQSLQPAVNPKRSVLQHPRSNHLITITGFLRTYLLKKQKQTFI